MRALLVLLLCTLLFALVASQDAKKFNLFPGTFEYSYKMVKVGGRDWIEMTADITGDWYAGVGYCPSSADGPIIACYVPPGIWDLKPRCAVVLGLDFQVLGINPELYTVETVSASQTPSGSTVTFRVPMDNFVVNPRTGERKLSPDGMTRVIFAYAKWDLISNMPLTHDHTNQYAVYQADIEQGTLVPLDNKRQGIRIVMIVCLIGFVLWIVIAWYLRNSLKVANPNIRNALGIITVLLYLLGLILFIWANYADYVNAMKHSPLIRAFGDATGYCLWFQLLPVTKLFGLPPLINIGHFKLVRYHSIFGICLWIVATIHGLGMIEYYGMIGKIGWLYLVDMMEYKRSNFSGPLCYIALLFVSIPGLLMRNKSYSFFRYTHLFFILAIFFAILHWFILGLFMIIPVGVYLIDLILRMFKSMSADPKVLSMDFYPESNLLTMTVRIACDPNGPSPAPGAYAYIGATGLGWIMHPFTIVRSDRAPNDTSHSDIKFMMRVDARGTWTRNLANFATVHNMAPQLKDREVEMAEKDHSAPTVQGRYNTVKFSFSGPYGNLTLPVESCGSIILIGGGIGVTSLLSFLHQINQGAPVMRNITRVRFCWSVRDAALLRIGVGEIAKMATNKLPQHIRFYFTGSENIDDVLPTIDKLNTTLQTNDGTGGAKFYRGRMDVTTELNSAANDLQPPVGAYCCGPESMMDEANAAVGATYPTQIYLHTEKFAPANIFW